MKHKENEIKYSHEITDMIIFIDKFHHKVSVEGTIMYVEDLDLSERTKLTKVIDISEIGAWYNTGEDIDVKSSYIDEEEFYGKARESLTLEFLK